VNNKKYLLFCTPKTAAKLQVDKLPSPYNEIDNIEIAPTKEIYINTLFDSWTDEECDDMVYLVEK